MILQLLALSTTWWVVSLSGVMSPGPISAVSLTEGGRVGFRAGPLISLGHALTELPLVVALALGLNQLLQQDLVAAVVGILGGLFLLWMGYNIALPAWRGQVSLGNPDAQAVGAARLGLVPAGFLLSVGNPYWLVWWATVGASYMLRFMRYGLLGLAVFYVGHILLDFAWNSFLASVGASGRRVISDRIYRGALVVCGLFLVFFGAYFVYSGLRFLS